MQHTRSSPIFSCSFPLNARGEGPVPSKRYTILHNCDFSLDVTFQDEEGREHRGRFPIHNTGKRVHTIALSQLKAMPALLISSSDDRRLSSFMQRTPADVAAESRFYEVTGARGETDDRFHLSTVCCINDTDADGTLCISSEEEYLPSSFPRSGVFYTEPLVRKRGDIVGGISKNYFFLHNYPVRLDISFSTDKKILRKVVPLQTEGLTVHNIAISRLYPSTDISEQRSI